MNLTENLRQTVSENPPAITDPALLEAATKQWQQESPFAGPIQVKRFNAAIFKLKSDASCVAVDQGTYISTKHMLLGKKTYFAKGPLEIIKHVGEAFNWTLTKKNAAAIVKEIEAQMDGHKADNDYWAFEIEREETDEEFETRTKREESYRQAEAKRAEEKAAADIVKAQILEKRPPHGVALIVAELDENQSDMMTDYFAHKTVKTVALAWRTGQREDFKQLRRAAATFEHTAHLADADKGVEHRDNHSGGGGNFLKVGSQHCSGWRVRSVPLDRDAGLSYLYGELEDRTPEAPAPVEQGELTQGEHYEIVKQFHSKRGIDIWTVVPLERTDREVFYRNRSKAKEMGGWYYKKYNGNEGGFHFPTPADAEAFAAEMEV